MNRAIEQNLSTLIPRLNTELPPQLIELASSLLAQSRHKASTLSQQEEIARTHACCNIACNRLKTTLNLPKIEPRPPVPKRVYDKLYKYLDEILEARPQRTPRKSVKKAEADLAPPSQAPVQKPTPRKKAANPSTTSASQQPLPSRPTPSKERSLAQFKPSTKGRKTELSHGGHAENLPAWIHPMIRALSHKLSAPAAASHALAGVTSVLTLPQPRPNDVGQESRKGMIPGLLAAVFIMTRTRLLGVQTSGKEYIALRRTVLDTMIELRNDKELKARVESIQKGKAAWEGWEEVKGRDVDGWLMELSAKGWTDLDWFGNIGNGAGLEVPEVGGDVDRTMVYDDDDVDMDDGGQDGDFGEMEGMFYGAGSMLQDKYDYLTARKREEFRVWKEGVMKRVEEFERTGSDRGDGSNYGDF